MAGGAGGAVDPGTGGGNPQPWYNGFEPELVGVMQNRGWDKLEAPAAAQAVLKSYRELETFRGVPETQLLKLPTNLADTEAMKPIYQRLGAPVDPKDYAFEGVDFGDDAMTAGFTDAVRATAAKFGLSKDAAAGVAADVFKYIQDRGAAMEGEETAAVAAEQQKLETSWGAKGTDRYTAAEFVAKQGALRIGITAEAIAAMEKTIGYAATMEAFLTIGKALGEAKFVAGAGSTQDGLMTRDQAIARKAELMGNGRMGSGDVAWQKKYLAGDTAARREMAALNQIITGVNP